LINQDHGRLFVS